MLRRRWAAAAAAGGVAVLIVAGVLTALLWPDPEVEPRPREYADATACLLAGEQGVAGGDGAAAWAGMQEASEQTSGQIRHLEVLGEQTVDNAKTFAGTPILGRCTVIVAMPGIVGDAVLALAGAHSGQQFVVVGGDASGLSNVRERLTTDN